MYFNSICYTEKESEYSANTKTSGNSTIEHYTA